MASIYRKKCCSMQLPRPLQEEERGTGVSGGMAKCHVCDKSESAEFAWRGDDGQTLKWGVERSWLQPAGDRAGNF